MVCSADSTNPAKSSLDSLGLKDPHIMKLSTNVMYCIREHVYVLYISQSFVLSSSLSIYVSMNLCMYVSIFPCTNVFFLYSYLL